MHCLKKSVESKNPWQSVIQTKMHLSESRMNRITRIARMNAKYTGLNHELHGLRGLHGGIQNAFVFKNPWNPKIRGNP